MGDTIVESEFCFDVLCQNELIWPLLLAWVVVFCCGEQANMPDCFALVIYVASRAEQAEKKVLSSITARTGSR